MGQTLTPQEDAELKKLLVLKSFVEVERDLARNTQELRRVDAKLLSTEAELSKSREAYNGVLEALERSTAELQTLTTGLGAAKRELDDYRTVQIAAIEKAGETISQQTREEEVAAANSAESLQKSQEAASRFAETQGAFIARVTTLQAALSTAMAEFLRPGDG